MACPAGSYNKPTMPHAPHDRMRIWRPAHRAPSVTMANLWGSLLFPNDSGNDHRNVLECRGRGTEIPIVGKFTYHIMTVNVSPLVKSVSARLGPERSRCVSGSVVSSQARPNLAERLRA
jgi:hypothetical protein